MEHQRNSETPRNNGIRKTGGTEHRGKAEHYKTQDNHFNRRVFIIISGTV